MSLIAPELDYTIGSWAPGFLDSPDPSKLPKGATPSAANCFFTHFGPDGTCQLAKRPGCRLLNPLAMTLGTRIDGLFEFRQEGDPDGELLAVCDGKLNAWDGGSLFAEIDDLSMTAGSAIEFMTFRNVAFIMNGTAQVFYDGVDTFPVGFIAPTAAPALATAGPVGPGVTGDYQSLATWYDSTHDHESSPSAYGAIVTFTADDRHHTKPAGSPPAQVDKWRIYVRKTSDNETYFKLVAEVAIATATFDEAIPDSQRNLATNVLAPLPNSNDVPPVFAFMGNALGYRFGVEPDDSFVHVSKLGYPQSQHPKDKFAVSRGDGNPVTTVKAVGKTIVVQKARRTFYLKGDRMPFVPEELDGGFGNHSQGASVEANGLYWAWDSERGPYVTDLASRWESLVDGRIATTFADVNRTAQIRCAHFKAQTLICWIVATGASSRLRTMLAYNYTASAWLPPIYGIEFAAITTFQTSAGPVNFYAGDEWGRVFEYFTETREGVPSGTLIADVTSATASTVTAALAAFYTTDDGLAGLPVAVVGPSGDWQFRTILSNTGTAITLDTTNGAEWDNVPDTTYRVVVGGIDWFWATPNVTWDRPMRRKKGGYLVAEVRASGSANSAIGVRVRLNDPAQAPSLSTSFTLRSGSAWGSGVWGVFKWGNAGKQPLRRRISRSFYGIQVEFSNRFPDEPIEFITIGLSADGLKGRWASA